MNQVTSLEDLDEEEMLMRAIAMSLEEEQKEGEVAQEELGSINIKGSGELLQKAYFQSTATEDSYQTRHRKQCRL